MNLQIVDLFVSGCCINGSLLQLMTTDKNIQAIVNRLTQGVGLDVFLSVKKRRSEKDFLFVENTNNGFCLFYSDRFFSYSPVERRAFLLHECFHIFQYLKNFPMLLCFSKKRKIFLVQHIQKKG